MLQTSMIVWKINKKAALKLIQMQYMYLHSWFAVEAMGLKRR